MILTVANIVYVLVAAAMIILILLQRGAGAAAGSGFGGGASATVFGSSGSANFLSKSTAVLATLFFAISLAMAMYASRSAQVAPAADDLGVMGEMEVPAAPADIVVPGADAPMLSVPTTDAAATSSEESVESVADPVQPPSAAPDSEKE